MRLGLSRSTLYRLFAPNGVAAYVSDRRLLAGMRMLVRNDAAGRTRTRDVAALVGFSDERTFRRAFKRRFGFAPTDAEVHAPDPGGDWQPLDVLRRWMDSL